MKIAIVGLGLIGGSLARAFKKYAHHTVGGYDRDPETLAFALKDGSVSAIADAAFLKTADVVFAALPPVAAADYLLAHASGFKRGAVISDVAGVKKYVHERVYKPLEAVGAVYLGAHPMAGREVSGYRNSDPDLFRGASLVLTPVEARQEAAVGTLRLLALEIGFGAVTVSDPETHDRVVAYTSELAHVVSGAYVQSPTLAARGGFSAGSFLDMTRVATLDPELWTDLTLLNREPLIAEIDTLIEHLSEYRGALSRGDRAALAGLFRGGKIKKLEDLERNGNR